MPRLKQAVPAGRTDIPVPGDAAETPYKDWAAVCDHPGAGPEGGACTCFCKGCHVSLKGREKCVCQGCLCGNSGHH